MIFIQNIWHHKIRAILLLGCVAVLFAAALFFFGIYPIAMVNGQIITAKQFHIASAAASTYYENMLKTYGQGKEDVKSINQAELESGILSGLIEDELIAEKLNTDLGKELPYVLNEKLGAVDNSADLKNAAATLYGMSWDDFKREILVSQAMRDILSEHLFLKKEKGEDWLASAKKSASIILFSSKFGWDGSKVSERK